MSLSRIIEVLYKEKEWVFSGIGIFVIAGVASFVKRIFAKKSDVKKEAEMIQINKDNSFGTQIGAQINNYMGENSNERTTNDGSGK